MRHTDHNQEIGICQGVIHAKKVNCSGRGNTPKACPRLPWGEEQANILLLACCNQDDFLTWPGISRRLRSSGLDDQIRVWHGVSRSD
jgi:hypothetical protein